MASPSELSLDCKPQSYSMLLKSFAEQQYPDQTKNLEEFLSCLEDERLKIDAFKRELPLCMQLLTNAVESSRQQLQTYRGHNSNNININTTTRPILEEFIPLKTSISEGSEKPTNTSDKANWMTSAQLWSQNSTTTDHATKLQPTPTLNKTTCQIHKDHQTHDHISFNVISPSSNNTNNNKLALDTKLQRNNGGAFLPFSKADRITATRAAPALPELALAASAEKEGESLEDKKSCLEGNIENIIKREKVGNIVVEQGKGGVNLHEEQNNNVVSTNNNITNTNNNNNNNNTNGSTTSSNNNNNNNNNNNQTHRKARRCWSPDLHRRFVSALQMLGGSQVATPKQIRELMKVDGLTNDEVKSHLQKYRLHTRRPSPSPQATGGGQAPPLVVGIWVPPEYAAAHGGGPAGLYPAPHSGPHYCGPPVPQDFYAAAPALAPAMAHQMHHHHAALHHHHQLQMYKAASQMVHGSPESDIRGGAGDRSESIEDGKSDSSSWKGESGGENGGGERKGLAALREDGEESNGSEITLKF